MPPRTGGVSLRSVFAASAAAGPSDLVCVEASVPTGFEQVAAAEARDALGLSPQEAEQVLSVATGKFFVAVRAADVDKALELRTVDRVWVVIGAFENVDLSGDKDDCLERLVSLLPELDWAKGLGLWRRIFDFRGRVMDGMDGLDGLDAGAAAGSAEQNGTETEAIPSFRCTCNRAGQKHSFGSMDAARTVGGAVQDRFGWRVQMKDSDVDVVVNVTDDSVHFGLLLTRGSLHRRTIGHFGPTTLRATVCSGLLRLADIKPGDVVLDPMCGGGSISLEGALTFPLAFHLGGDIHEKAYARTADNVRFVQHDKRGLAVDVAAWDVTAAPLRDSCVDVVVTDLPFGKRSGSKADNRVLYPAALKSLARVVRPVTGRAVLLTYDKNSMFKTMGAISAYWRPTRQMYCNIGGLAAQVFVMKRTADSPTAGAPTTGCDKRNGERK